MDLFLENDLKALDQQGLRRSLRSIASPQSREIIVNGKKVLNFCSNNYLGLADDPRIIKAAAQAMATYGFGSGASRLVCGNMAPHEALEAALAKFKHTESALVFNSGYAANTGIIPALFDREDIIFSDKLNHASIVDGILLSRAEFRRYAHVDMESLEEGLKKAAGYKKRLIATDHVFSMDGDIAPLKEIIALARRYDAWVMVDEAHSFVVLENFVTTEVPFIQIGTLSKAVGCFGAYVCGSKNLREYLINHARSFIYTTAMPPAMAAAATKAIEIIQTGPQRQKNLIENAQYVRAQLNIPGPATPIIPIIVKDADKAVAMSKQLLEQGIFVQAIRPPTVPINTARLRVTVMATHTKEDLDRLLEAIPANSVPSTVT